MPTEYEQTKVAEERAGRSYVKYEKEGNIARVILDDPEHLNPWSDKLAVDFDKTLVELEGDDDIKVIIIKGAGKVFCAGADLRQVYDRYRDKPGDERRPSQRNRLKIDRARHADKLRRLFLCPKITIAQVHGYCIGLGTMLMVCCDIIIAANNAMIGHTEQRLGFSGTAGMFSLLVARVGLTRAIDLILPGKLVSGTEAEQIGLITRAAPPDKLELVAETRAKEIALLPRDGIAIGKAARQIAFDRMGLLSPFSEGYVMHSFFTNLRWEPDEYNFVKERKKRGSKAAFGDRDNLWGGLTLRSDAIARGEVED